MRARRLHPVTWVLEVPPTLSRACVHTWVSNGRYPLGPNTWSQYSHTGEKHSSVTYPKTREGKGGGGGGGNTQHVSDDTWHLANVPPTGSPSSALIGACDQSPPTSDGRPLPNHATPRGLCPHRQPTPSHTPCGPYNPWPINLG